MSRMEDIRAAILAGFTVDNGQLVVPRLKVKNGYTTRRHDGERRHWAHAHLSAEDAAEVMGLSVRAVRDARKRYGIPE